MGITDVVYKKISKRKPNFKCNTFSDTFARLSKQDEVRQVSDEHNRSLGNSSLLRQHRSRQLDLCKSIDRGQTNRSVLQDHENSQV